MSGSLELELYVFVSPPKVGAVCRLGPLQDQLLAVEPAPFWEIFIERIYMGSSMIRFAF